MNTHFLPPLAIIFSCSIMPSFGQEIFQGTQSISLGSMPNQSPAIDSYINGNSEEQNLFVLEFPNSPSAISSTCDGPMDNNSGWVQLKPSSDQIYTISTLLGVNAFSGPSSISLWRKPSNQPWQELDCSPSAMYTGKHQGAALTYELKAGEWYGIRITKTSDEQQQVALAMGPFKSPEFDCINQPYDLDDLFDESEDRCLVSSGLFQAFPSFFHSGLLRLDSSAQLAAQPSINNPNAVDCYNNSLNDVGDVWFTYNYDSDAANLICLYAALPGAAYGMQIFTASGTVNSCNFNGLNHLACSAPDGLGKSGGVLNDWARGDLKQYARLSLNHLNLNDGDQVYLRVYPLLNDPLSLSAGFRIRLEHAAQASLSSCDDLSHNNRGALQDPLIDDPEVGMDFYEEYQQLSNGGFRGGLGLLQGSTAKPTGNQDEPGQFVIPAGSTYQTNGCGQTQNLQPPVGQYFDNNNSAFYAFSVNQSQRVVPLPDTLFSFGIMGGGGGPTVTPLDSPVRPLPFQPGDTADVPYIPSDDWMITIASCSGVSLDTIKQDLGHGDSPGVGFFVPTGYCDSVVATCGADVMIRLKNMKMHGILGQNMEMAVVPAPALNQGLDGMGEPTYAYFGGVSQSYCQGPYELRSSSFYLPPGDYYIVVDGEDGLASSYDLDLNIQYRVPGTNISCANGRPISPQYRNISTPNVNSLFQWGVLPEAVYPLPANNQLNVRFKVPSTDDVLARVVDMYGQEVYREIIEANEGENLWSLPTHHLKAGGYQIIFEYRGLVTTVKSMVMH